ncbi:sensor histidine kinase [Anaerotignum faecicola]|nr:sensor histidine kinase [Anaerotignum faecicola]
MRSLYESLKKRCAGYRENIGLSQVIWLSFTLTALAAVILAGLSFYGRFSAQAQQTIREENQSLLEQVSSNCSSYLRGVMKVSDTIYYSVIKKTDFSKESIGTSLQLLYETNKDNIESIAVLTVGGELLDAAPAATLKRDIDIKNEQWYKAAILGRENMHFSSPEVSHIFAGGSTDYTWVIPLSRAVEITRGNAAQTGILVINMRYSGLSDILSGVLLGDDAYIYLIDSKGEILYHPLQQLISSGQAAENNKAAASYRDGNYSEVFMGQKRDITVKTIGYTGWKLIGVTPQNTVELSAVKSNLFVAFMALFLLTALILINSYISGKVAAPIKELEESVKGFEYGDWDAPIKAEGFYEVRRLGNSIGNMAGHIKILMADIVAEHEAKRKSELTALQNQINPHFLYNTLDIIVWMIENEKKAEAVRAVTALARFFRISLSRGKNIIPVKDEIEHVKNYLMIQDMRFKNRFTYGFEADEDVETLGTNKLILQPVVENAIYHAMEFMDGDGRIQIKAWEENGVLTFMVEDNGCGMTKEVCGALLKGETVPSKKGSGMGVRNVQERIRLLFGPDYGLDIESEPDEGTKVFIRLPAVPYEKMKEMEAEGHE